MNKVSSPRRGLFNKASSGWARPEYFLGWARPIYINRHPQPPAKYIRFSEISKSLFTRIVKINMLTAAGPWDKVGCRARLIIFRSQTCQIIIGPWVTVQ